MISPRDVDVIVRGLPAPEQGDIAPDDQFGRRHADHPGATAPARWAPVSRTIRSRAAELIVRAISAQRQAPAPPHTVGWACHAGVVTGHPPTHGRRTGAARADGLPAGDPAAACAPGDAHTVPAHAPDAHTGEPRSGEQGWAALHGGIRPSAVVRLWLRGRKEPGRVVSPSLKMT